MKKHLRRLMLLCTAGAMFVACSNNELEPTASTDSTLMTAIGAMPGGNASRVILTEDNDAHKLRVTWKESGETFAVYVNDDNTGYAFEQTGVGADNKTATFESSSFAENIGNMTSGDVCLAIYSGTQLPTSNTELSIDKQSGTEYNDAFTHMYAKTTFQDANTPLTFKFKHLTAALKATVQFPDGVTDTATDVYLTADGGLPLTCYMDFRYDTPEPAYYPSTGNITFENSDGFLINNEGKITVYANLFPYDVENLCLIATVNGKIYKALLMEDMTLEAGNWYYPQNGAKTAIEANGFTVDDTANTLNFTQADDLALYSQETVKELISKAISSTDGLLKITGTPSSQDLQRVGEAASQLNSLKILDLSECTSLTTLPSKVMYCVTSLIEVRLPPSVKVIDSDAFNRCTNLTTINLDNIQTIGIGAFINCQKIEEYNLPQVTTIRMHAFSYTNFKNLNAPLLVTLESDVFTGAIISGIVNLPKCTNVQDNWGTNGEFTLKLTSAETIGVTSRAFSINGQATHINLVLNTNKKTEVENENSWKSTTFKSITFEEPRNTIE